ncbi:hypothetical protein [Vibrio sp. 1CM23M]|uniref:hypothetical protein n=1 Tax=Vibrio sp. 1CM23M TaxID=2929164 RepID=UPI0020BE27CF|nr:hypothetical protein [Vibrio sp. 1CM23M]MCK8072427.1 hypothetical protein [Vibrio sp. 1CM23M]
MNYKSKSIKGLTLIETMISLSIASAASVGYFSNKVKQANDEEARATGMEIAKILSAVDSRLATDGYEISRWTKTKWKDAEINSNLMMKQLNASSATGGCGVTDWSPVNAVESSFKTMPCKGLWGKIPYGMNVEASIKSDSSAINIDNFDLLLSFPDQTGFEENFRNMKLMLNAARNNSTEGFAGDHNFSFVKLDTKQEIGSTACIMESFNCGLLASFNRAGGAEYLRADGGNSIIGKNLSFIEGKGSAPMKCARWKESTSGWGLVEVNGSATDEECGIGIYKKTGEPLMVEVLAENGTFESVMLDKECDRMEWDSTTQMVIANTTNAVPCGMHNESGTTIQVLDNTMAAQSNILALNANNARIQSLNVKDNATFNTVSVNGEFKALQKAILNEVEAQSLTVYGNTKLASAEIDSLQVNNNINVNGSVTASNGNFGNINREISTIKSAHTGLSSRVVSNTRRIVALEARVAAIPTGPDYEALKSECNNKLNGTIGTFTVGCTGYRQSGLKIVLRTKDYYWHSGSNSCSYNLIETDVDTRSCYHVGGGQRD